MNGMHDVGGMTAFGPVEREVDEPVFHADWERRVFGLQIALGKVGGVLNVAESRLAVERLDPHVYMAARYYQRWILAMEDVLIARGVLSRAEIETRVDAYREAVAPPLARHESEAHEERMRQVLGHGSSKLREIDAPPRFEVGDAVLTHNNHPRGHTRLPLYARGRRGTIAAHHGAFPFADTLAERAAADPQHVYSVRFAGEELWGESAEPHTHVLLDLFESYLEPGVAR
jgi:nitrile hydratase beta subunit